MGNIFELTWNYSCEYYLCFLSLVQGKEILRDEIPISEIIQSIATMVTNVYASGFCDLTVAPNYCGLPLSPSCEIIIAFMQGIENDTRDLVRYAWNG